MDFFRKLRSFLAAAVAAVPLASGALAQQGGTLEQVRQRGVLNCGVSQGLIGFSIRAQDGAWSGFDVDFCKAVAAAVLGDASKVAYVPLSAVERFDALRQGRIDVLSRNSTWTLQREAEFGLLFAAVNFHDGQGFMAHRSLNVSSAPSPEPPRKRWSETSSAPTP
jgi:general L-amino acid transport system substrate-binding protein